ncbi:hypothetical protein KQX54_015363 [Cotesia glomerata]|uniref:Uncharacterized protein n=1 Tax=Cotesia glomerata TaxID=32391 RepID=A0AAV7IAQ9_COTGL|nr:hypothetical protein KQX54_015363 [Cotesia glomerata]
MKLREKVYQIKAKCSKKSEAAIKKAIMKLPKGFQNVVNSCFEAANKKNCKGRRYTLEWIYECILIHIKSRRAYQFLRTRNILPLPCIETLNKFIRRISSSAYGFQPATFQGLQQRCETMDKGQKRGVLLVDEMKLIIMYLLPWLYQPICDKLKDSTPIQKFIDLVFNVIEAMSSRIPRDALYAEGNCRKKQAILEFLQFFESWENLEKKIPVSKSTSIGLKVTLRTTLEILDMLKNECGYKYLMTATLSQDPLEIFFWCNVSGDNLLKNLMKPDEVLSSSNHDRESWLQKMDAILEGTEPQVEDSSIDEDHDYNEVVTSDVVQSYIAGYLTRKMQKIVKCSDCLITLRMNAVDGQRLQRNDVINKMNLFGGLMYASYELFELTKQ